MLPRCEAKMPYSAWKRVTAGDDAVAKRSGAGGTLRWRWSRDRELVEHLSAGLNRANKYLVPDLDDWIQVGKVLERLAAKYDYERIGRGRLTNDALIAMSAARKGIRVITANEKDFRRLAEFRSFAWQLVTLQH